MYISRSLLVLIAGFIDFIVEPSFQVMGDMLDKILAPMQQKRSEDDEDESAVQKVNRATNTGSVDSLRSTESVSGAVHAATALQVPDVCTFSGMFLLLHVLCIVDSWYMAILSAVQS